MAEGKCFQVLLLTGCLGLDAAVRGRRDAEHHCSMMWLNIRRGYYPLSRSRCDHAGWLELSDPSLPHVHGQTVSHQPCITLFSFLAKYESSTLCLQCLTQAWENAAVFEACFFTTLALSRWDTQQGWLMSCFLAWQHNCSFLK